MKTNDLYLICEVSKTGNIIQTYHECKTLENARVLRKIKLKHLVESGLIEETLVIMKGKRIVN